MSMFDKLKDQVANAGEKLKEEIQKALLVTHGGQVLLKGG